MDEIILKGFLLNFLWVVFPSRRTSIPEGSGDHYILAFAENTVESEENKKALLSISFDIAETLSERHEKGRWRIETSGPKLVRVSSFHIHIICPNVDFEVRKSVDNIGAK